MEMEMIWEGGGGGGGGGGGSSASSSAAAAAAAGGGGGGDGGGGGGGRRKPSWRERENNRRRERRRRAIAAKIYSGLRAQANYNLPNHCDNNEVLKALCAEAGWIVEPDGTTYRKGSRPPPIDIGITSATITPSSSRRPSPPSSYQPTPIPSYQPSPSSSAFPSPSRLDAHNGSYPFPFLHTSMPSSLAPLRISNSAPVTPPISSPTARILEHYPNWESYAKESMSSFNLPFFGVSAPVSPTRRKRFAVGSTIPERMDESDSSTIDSGQWVQFQKHGPTLGPNSPAFNLMKPMDYQVSGADTATLEKGKGKEFEFENAAVNPWKGERYHDVGLDDLELTLGSGSAKV